MQKKLTITLDEEVYETLHSVIGYRYINHFIEELIRPYLLERKLEAGYQEMAKDEARESEALEWAESTIEDVSNEPR